MGKIVLTALSFLGLLVLAGMLVALSSGIAGSRDGVVIGGGMTLMGIAPVLWLLFSDLGQIVSESTSLTWRPRRRAECEK